MSILAVYHGICAACEDAILPGERIESIDDEWQHETCGAQPETASCMCSRCFAIHVGEC